MKGHEMTLADAKAHAAKHGYELFVAKGQAAQAAVDKILKPRQNKTELAYGLILEAQKQRGEIVEYRHEGISLAWGVDPNTGKPMWYTPDYYVVETAQKLIVGGALNPERGIFWTVGIRIIEIKSGARASKTYKDRVRFRGCRACWPMFQFELWQKKAGNWTRLE